MNYFRNNPGLKIGFLFLPAVILPGLILSFLALQTLSREEIVFEKQLEKTLQEELSQTIALFNSEINLIEKSLADSVEKINRKEAVLTPSEFSILFKNMGGAVDTPFIVSSDFNLLYPVSQPSSTESQELFLVRNSEFLTNRIEIPWYQNIAKVYRERILDDSEEEPSLPLIEAEQTRSVRSFSSAQLSSDNEQDENFVSGDPNQYKNSIVVQTQQAVTQLEQNEELRTEIYEQIQKEGGTVVDRIVNPKSSSKSFDKKAKQSLLNNNSSEELGVSEKQSFSEPILRVKSILVANNRSFESIIEGKTQGIIPRIQNDQLHLLFWKRLEEGRLLGCSIHMDYFINRLETLIPVVNNGIRIINLMDEYGHSLLKPNDDIGSRSWLSPFISREMSEVVPGWELAVVLVDDQYISSRVSQKRLLMILLISILVIAMFFGGGMIYYSTVSQIRAAAMKSGFVANVSHELKTPLTSIRMYAEMLQGHRIKDKEKEQRYLTTIVNESERLTRLINNVLDFSRLEKEKKIYDFQPVELNRICCDLLETQRLRLEQKGFSISCHEFSQPLNVLADSESIRQILINLISNGEKYSDEEKVINIRLKKEEKTAVIIVADRGIGIPDKAKEAIFKEFYRVDDSLTARVNGSGLGLTISRKIVEDHQGRLFCRDAKETGTEFVIQLPLISDVLED